MKLFPIATFILLFLCCTIQSFAQAPNIISTIPENQFLTAATNSSITINFDIPIDPTSISASSFKAFGRWSGPANLSYTFSNANMSITANPAQSFFFGEWVTVMLTPAITSSSGISMPRSYSFNFWIGTLPGTMNQNPIDTIYLRQGTETFLQAYGAYAGDLNNDEFTDLTVINEYSDDLRVLLNDGSGQYSNFSVLPMGSSKPSPNEGADFNSDGEIDLAVSTAWDNEVRILLGDGTGSFTSMDQYTTGMHARSTSILDINVDGHDDIFITNRSDNNTTTLINDGLGNFTVNTFDIDLVGTGEMASAPADVNNDGIMDVFVGYYFSKEVAVYLGDGNGSFTISDRKSVTGGPWMMAAGDVNGDGNADVVSANSNGNVAAVLFGDGAGGLSAPMHYSAPNSYFPLAIDLGDLDGDGDLEIVTSNYSSNNYIVFENLGNGIFEFELELISTNHASCAILHDRDNDGDLDITATDEGDDILILYENDPTCPGSLYFTGSAATQSHQAGLYIESDAQINGVNVIYTAGQSITLNNGFCVDPGSTFDAEILNCGF